MNSLVSKSQLKYLHLGIEMRNKEIDLHPSKAVSLVGFLLKQHYRDSYIFLILFTLFKIQYRSSENELWQKMCCDCNLFPYSRI